MKEKIIKNRTLFFSLIALLVLFVSCDNAKYSIIDNGIYIIEAQNSNSTKITVDDQGGSATLTVRASKSTADMIGVTLKYAPEAVEAFNQRNGTNYVALPAESFTLSSLKATISPDKVSADVIEVKVKSLTDELITSGNKFIVPITIVSNTANAPIFANTKTMFYIIDQVIVTAVPIVNRNNNLNMTMRQDYSLDQWSVEFRFNIDKLGHGIGQMNNQALFAAFGDGGEIYTRFGDAPIDGRIYQIKTQGSQFNSNTQFKENTWYHFAIVNDGAKVSLYVNGQLDSSLDAPGKVTNLSKDRFQFGNTSHLRSNVKVSELRFWTKAITPSQISNNMFAINPHTEGLEAYWKLNEGLGNTFKDFTGHGNVCVSAGTTTWIQGVRSDDK